MVTLCLKMWMSLELPVEECAEEGVTGVGDTTSSDDEDCPFVVAAENIAQKMVEVLSCDIEG